MKRLFIMGLLLAVLAIPLTGCSTELRTMLTPVSREDGSGTRGAFVELFGIEGEDEQGRDMDMTTDCAEITNSTAVMLMTVSGNPNAIGYISMGAMNDMVKTVKIDGVEATFENIENGSYKIARPFHIAINETVTDAAMDFIGFIQSEEGQAIVEESGYISIGNTGAYEKTDAKGTITVAGSSSVAPVVEKIKEAYEKINSDVSVQLQQNDSTTGMASVKEGTCEIGMASRELKESELAAGLQPIVIAMDGIAVIVNHENQIENLSSEDVRAIYMGEVTNWSEIQ